MLMSQRRFETWAVFAMQILWDTQRELGPMLQIGSQLLGKTARELIESYQVYLNTEGLDKVGGLHKMFRSDMEARRNHIVAVALDVEFQPVTDQREEKVPWKVLELQGFSLLQCHPALCGLILADIRDEHHRTSFDMAGDQCQILVAAHLYNAAHQSEFLSKDVQWADMDWFIEQQGSDWIFVGARPQQGIEIARRLGLARGLGITRYAKDYKYPKSGLGSEGIHCVRGKNRRLDYLARLSQLSYERQGNPYKKISGSSRAKEDILVMLDALIKDYLGPEGASTKLSPLDTLCTFKDAVQMDEFALNFDVMEFYLRCMELLRKIQDHCLTHAPLDYPEEMFDKGIGMNTVTAELLHDLSGRPRFHGIMFPHAVTMLRNVIVEEGSAVLTKARARQHQKKLQHTETGNEVEPSFENPPEDDLPVKLRSQCGFMVFQDENGDCRMLFDSR
ncbi:uncharacterized protein K460DRAFT_370122 [Cucurbitaria berberidis CBS 394.84]|uniref:Uncharacterized protein n=1 Tax=Cucurbitaria berberidis CBS 394.84 TaxID=1168544 RepID=A0A9P4GAD2_9PLEO|nr:uncharacterized protein K460DRAFT_370122 [Cucurbitaria berberidis CBS 394.84]KAF1842128.1 hypothetical protein K460DRAFT_370122 [Cucurbitaria berberidis CBS 394.84]